MIAREVTKDLVGKTVTWESQSHGIMKRKTGKVVAFVPGGGSPRKAIATYGLYTKSTSSSMPFPGNTRDHNSVLVDVDGNLYWPRISQLEVTNA